MKRLATWKLILSSLHRNIPVMLLYVVESSGSSPGRQGFDMAVNTAGEMAGSIGGGIMEHKFVEMVLSKLASGVRESSIYRQVHNKTAATLQSGMICSGEQTIFLLTLIASDVDTVTAIVNCLEQNNIGLLQLSHEGIRFSSDPRHRSETKYIATSPANWNYSELLGYRNHLHIIGAGHCSLALSRIMQQLDFYIHLYDDRKDLKTMMENDFVHKKEILEDYHQLQKLVNDDPSAYVVLMTFGYRTDAIALRALITKNFKYLGMLGSGAKIKKMMADMEAEGFERSLLQKIHAPIGIAIKSQTPEEVAISIAAEIISVKNA